MEIIRKEVDVYVCSDGFETIEKWRAETHQKSLDEEKSKLELLKNIDKMEWVENKRFIRFAKDLDYREVIRTIEVWCKSNRIYDAKVSIYQDVIKDKWYEFKMSYQKEEDDDESCDFVVELKTSEHIIQNCKAYLDFLGQEEQLKLF